MIGRCRVHTAKKTLFSWDCIHECICLISEGNFPVTYTMMFAILKMNEKWQLFDGISFNETSMDWTVMVKSRSKTLITTCALFWAFFTWKKKQNIAGMTVQFVGLNTRFSFATGRSKSFRSHNNMFAYFTPNTFT